MKVIPLCGCSKDALQERLQVLATAGSLSRAKGTVSDVFESRGTFEKDCWSVTEGIVKTL